MSRTLKTNELIEIPAECDITESGNSISYIGSNDLTAVANDVAKGKKVIGKGNKVITGTYEAPIYWELIGEDEFEISNSGSGTVTEGTIDLSGELTKDDIVFIHIRDKAGKREGYVYGSDNIILNDALANEVPEGQAASVGTVMLYVADSIYKTTGGHYGVYGGILTNGNDLNVTILSKYSSSRGIINGTFNCKVYKLIMPNDITIFE